jgi:hypothetical protein
MKRLLENAGFEQHDIIIVDLGPSMRSIFLQNAFKSKVLPKRHEYGVVMRKPGGVILEKPITDKDIEAVEDESEDGELRFEFKK